MYPVIFEVILVEINYFKVVTEIFSSVLHFAIEYFNSCDFHVIKILLISLLLSSVH